MSERKINLEEILRNKIGYLGSEPNLSKLIKERATSHDIISAMKEACKQILELAAEKIKSDALEEYGSEVPDCWSEQSILDTINQVE